jgi:hypothetical protein
MFTQLPTTALRGFFFLSKTKGVYKNKEMVEAERLNEIGIDWTFVFCTIDGIAFALNYCAWFYNTKAYRFHFNYLEFILPPL